MFQMGFDVNNFHKTRLQPRTEREEEIIVIICNEYNCELDNSFVIFSFSVVVSVREERPREERDPNLVLRLTNRHTSTTP